MCGSSGSCQLFQGKVMFCLKDCQRSAEDSIHREFSGKLTEVAKVGLAAGLMVPSAEC